MEIIKGFLSELTLITKGLNKWKWKRQSLSHVRLFVTLRTIQSMEFSRPEYWSGKPFPSLGDLPNPWIKLGSPALRVDSFFRDIEKCCFEDRGSDYAPRNACISKIWRLRGKRLSPRISGEHNLYTSDFGLLIASSEFWTPRTNYKRIIVLFKFLSLL